MRNLSAKQGLTGASGNTSGTVARHSLPRKYSSGSFRASGGITGHSIHFTVAELHFRSGQNASREKAVKTRL